MPFELPSRPTFDAALWAENIILSLNQYEESVVRGFISNYETLWGVSGSDQKKTIDDVEVTVFVGNGCRHTIEQMQSIIDVLGAGFINVKTAADSMIAYIKSQGGVVPERYLSAAFEYELSPSGIKLTKLADVWAVPVKEDEVTP